MTSRSSIGDCARSAGFTLVELMVVIAIIAGLAAIVGTTTVYAPPGDADRATAQAQIRTFSAALVTYKIQFNKFPGSLDELVNDSKTNFLDTRTVPLDPWGNSYVYKAEGRSFTITSYGEDGTPGGIDGDADISNDDLADE